jgi:hypothetical protein
MQEGVREAGGYRARGTWVTMAGMSRSRSNKRQAGGRGPVQTSRPPSGAKAIRSGTLMILLLVDLIVALLMIVSFAQFVFKPDPSVKAGPMYVTLALTTGAAMLMLIAALNATYLPFMSRQRARDVQLVMFAMAVTGVATGLLTVGGAANAFLMRLVLGGIAFVFITMQNTRLTLAREAAAAGQAGPQTARPRGPAPQAREPAAQPQPRTRSRQRRGGRKH